MNAPFVATALLVAGFAFQENTDPAQIIRDASALEGGERRTFLGSSLDAVAADEADRVRLCDALLAALESSPDAELESYVLEWRWRALRGTERFDEIRSTAERWRDAAARGRLGPVLGDAWMAIGLSAFHRGDLDEADRAIAEAVECYDARTDTMRMGNAMSVRGGIAFKRGDYAAATEHHLGSLRVAEEVDNAPLRARSWNNVGIVYKHVGSHEDARDAFQRAHDLFVELGDERSRLAALGNLSSAYRELGEFARALDVQRELLAHHEANGPPNEEVADRTRLGLTLLEMGRHDEAAQELRAAVSMRRQLGMKGGLGLAMFDLGRTLLLTGETDDALRALEEAKDSLDQEPDTLARDVYQKLAEGYLSAERYAEARAALDRFVELERGVSLADLQERNEELVVRSDLLTEQHELAQLRSRREIDRLALERQRARNLALAAGCATLAAICVALLIVGVVRRRLLAEARRSERLYRCLFDDASAGHVLLDAGTGIVLELNQQASRWLGHERDAIRGERLAAIAPDLPLDGAVSTWEPSQEVGAPVIVEVSVREVSQEGRSLALLTLRDVTSVRQLEEEQRRSQTLDSLSLLAAGIAHDFNNALTSVIGNISVARTDFGREQLDELLVDAEAAAKQACRLTDQLLTFARGGAPITRDQAIRDRLMEWASFSRAGTAVQVRFDLPEDLWPARYDEGQLAQVIHNLIVNAQEAMRGRGEVFISAANVTIGDADPLGLPRGQFVRVRVRDTGPGVPDELRDDIFTPYFSTNEDGRGLGLATSYAILKRHGGLLRLVDRSEDRPGATFEALIPAAPDATPEEPEAPGRIEPDRRRVLVVDDEDRVRATLASMLSRIGCDVRVARDGETAAPIVSDHGPFDLAIIDATIPAGCGGKDALRLIREVQPDLVAVLTSGYSSRGELARFREDGFEAMLKKPFSMSDLADVVRVATSGSGRRAGS